MKRNIVLDNFSCVKLIVSTNILRTLLIIMIFGLFTRNHFKSIDYLKLTFEESYFFEILIKDYKKNMGKHNILIAGAGGIGQAVGLILGESDALDVTIYLGDISEQALQNSYNFITKGCTQKVEVHTIVMPREGTNDEWDKVLDTCDILLDCLPGSLAPKMARFCVKHQLHYANLTEYVAETNEIMEIAKNAETGFALQTGVAPGFVNILGNYLYQQFQEQYGNDELELMEMKVGALSENASAPHFYAFTWSPIGVATEYVKDAIVVKNNEIVKVPSLSDRQELVLQGKRYEDNYTSGGAADFPEAFQYKIKNINYKTLRYVGHYNWVQEQLDELGNNPDVVQILEKRMLDQIPTVENDFIIIYCQVKGKADNGRLRALDKVVNIYPMKIGNQTLRAIQSTTAAPLCECARMLLQGEMKNGINLQSQIDPSSFIKGPFVKMVYGELV